MPEENQSPSPSISQPLGKHSRNWKKILPFLLVGLFLISLVGVGIYLLIPRLTEEPPSQKQVTSLAEPKEEKDLSKPIPFAKDFNIWVFYPSKDNYEQLTTNGEENNLEYSKPQALNKETISYIKCEIKQETEKCDLIKYDLKNKKPRLVLEKTSTYGENLISYDWSDEQDSVAYIFEPIHPHAQNNVERRELQIGIYDVSNNKDTLLKKILSPQFGSGAYGNTTNIKFSPNNQKLLLNLRLSKPEEDIEYIDPSGKVSLSRDRFKIRLIAGTSDLNKILILDLKGKIQTEVFGTYGGWLSDNEIVYEQAFTLVKYNLASKQETVLLGSYKGRFLTVSPNRKKLAYETGGFVGATDPKTYSKIWVLDIDSLEQKQLVNLKSRPSWYNSYTLLVYNLKKCQQTKTGACSGPKSDYQLDFTVSGININDEEIKFNFEVGKIYPKGGLIN